MARVYARQAAHKVACDGLRWVAGAGQTDPTWHTRSTWPAHRRAGGADGDMDADCDDNR